MEPPLPPDTEHATFDQLVARRVRMARERRGFSQRSAATDLRMHRDTYWQIEHGTRPLRLEEFALICRRWRVPPLWLLTDTVYAAPFTQMTVTALGRAALAHIEPPPGDRFPDSDAPTGEDSPDES